MTTRPRRPCRSVRSDTRAAGTRALIVLVALRATMPPTKEVKCTADDCYLDMFENHYTYDVPEDHDVSDLSCPVCGGTDCLEPIEL